MRCALSDPGSCVSLFVWWRAVKHFVVRNIVKCLSNEVSVNIFLVLCDVCWLWYGFQDTCVMSVRCICFLSVGRCVAS